MIPLDIPFPVASTQTAGEAIAAKKAASQESDSNFKETLDDVASNAKAAEEQQVRSKKLAREAAEDGGALDPEVMAAEQANREARADSAAKKSKNSKESKEVAEVKEAKAELKDELSPDFVALPEMAVPVNPQPTGSGFEAAAGGVAVGGALATQGGVEPDILASLTRQIAGDVMQGGRGNSIVKGGSGPNQGGNPFGLRSASASSGKTATQGVRTPLSAQSPTFSAELAEKVGNMRLISRSGISDQVRINLTPRDLGNLDIRLQVDSEQRVHMLVTTETEAAKDLMKNQITQLKESLLKQGMEFGDVDIQVDLQQRENGPSTQAELQWGGDERFDFNGGPGGEEQLEDEEIAGDPMIMGKIVHTSDGSMSVFI
jgi:hypothetical protein